MTSLDEVRQLRALEPLYPGWVFSLRNDAGTFRWWAELCRRPSEAESMAGVVERFGAESVELLLERLAEQAELIWRSRAY